MAKTIDQRVVEMQFNNTNFEKNVGTTMSTLDRLKEKLNFKGATKGLDDLNSSIKNCDMSPLEKAIDTVHVKFSAWEVMAVTALTRITNAAIDAGKQLVKSLSTDNISAGWQKFGDKTVSVGVLSSQGYEMEEINKQLDMLNWFTDETSYNFNDMVGEIGKFTAAGQDLEDSVAAMEGIATWAALSGQNAATASRAMYQLSQAMGAGAMRMQDWRSIQNANMDTKEFRQTVLDTAVALGTLKKNADDTYESLVNNNGRFTIDQFTEHLTKDAWFTSEVMMSVYKNYGKAAKMLQAYVDAKDLDTASEAIAKIKEEAEKYMESMEGYGEEGFDKVSAMNEALKSVSLDAMKEVPEVIEEADKWIATYNQHIDEAVREETEKISNNDYIKEFMESYNAGLGEGETKLTSIDQAKAKMQEYITQLQESKISVDDYDTALEKMGYTLDDLSLKAFMAGQEARTWADVLDSVKDAVSTGWSKTFENIFGDYEHAKVLWTDLANELYDVFATGGNERNEMLAEWNSTLEGTRKSGRDLLFSNVEGDLGALWNLFYSLTDIINAVKKAFRDIFPPMTADRLYKITENFKKLTENIKGFVESISDYDDEALRNALPTSAFEAMDKAMGGVEKKAGTLRRTLRGLFAIAGIVVDFFKAGFTVAVETLSELFGNTSGNIFDTTAKLGDNIVAFRKWLKQSGLFTKVFKTIFGALKSGIDVIKWFVEKSHIGDFIANGIGLIGKLAGAIGDLVSRLMNGENFGEIIADMFKDVHPIENAKNAFADAKKGIKDFFDGLAQSSAIFKGIKDFFKDVPKFLKDCFDAIVNTLSNANIDLGACFEAIKNTFSNLTMDDIITAGVIIGIVLVIKSLLSITDSVNTIAGSFDKLTGTIKNFFGNIKKALHANTLLVMAGAILMLCGALITLGEQDPNKLWNAVAVVGALAGGLTLMLLVFSRMKDFGPAAVAVIGLAGAIALLGVAVSLLANMETKGLVKIGVMMAGVAAFMLLIGAIVTRLMSKEATFEGMAGFALMLVGLGVSLLLMVGAIKQLANLEGVNVDGAINTMLKLMTLMMVVTTVSSFAKGSGSAILAMSFSLYLIIGFVKLFNLLDLTEAYAGLAAIDNIFRMFGETLALAHGLPLTQSKGLGSAFLGMSAAIYIIFAVIKSFGDMDQAALDRGVNAVLWIMGGMAVIAAVSGLLGDKTTISSKLSGKIFKKTKETEKNYSQVSKSIAAIGNLLIKMAVAIGILALVMKYITTIPNDNGQFAGALVAVDSMLLLFAVIVGLSGKAAEVDSKSLTKITNTIIVISALLAVLTVAKPENAIAAGEAMLMALGGLAAFVAALAGVVAMANKSGVFTAKVMDRIMLSIMGAIVALGGIFWALSVLNVHDVFENAAGLTVALIGLSEAMAVISVLAKTFSETKFKNLYSLVGAMSVVAIVILPFIALALGEMSGLYVEGAAEKAAAIGLVLMAIAGALALFTKFGGDRIDVGNTTKLMLVMSAVVAILGLVLAEMNGLQVKDQIGNVLALSVLLLAMSGALVIITNFGKGNTGAVGAMVLLSAAVGILGMVLAMMSALHVQDAMPNVLALSVLLLAMSASLVILNLVGPQVGLAVVYMGLLSGVLYVLGMVLASMKDLPVNSAMPNAQALSVLMLAMSAALVILNFVGPQVLLSTVYMLILSGVVAILGEVLKNMKDLPVDSAMPNAQALSVLLLAMSGALVILNFVLPNVAVSVAILYLLSGVVAILSAILGGMSTLPVGSAMPNVEALSALLMAMTQSLLLLNFVGPLAGTGVLVLYLMTGVVAILAAIMGSMIEMKVNEAMPNAEALIFMLQNITNIMIQLLPVGVLAPFAIASIVALVAFVGAVFEMTTALGALITAFPMLEEFVDKGIPLLEKLGYGVGAFLGSIVGGFAAGVSNGLPEIGKNLGEALGNFCAGFSKVDDPAKIGQGADGLVKLFEACQAIPEKVNDPTAFVDVLYDIGFGLSKFYEGLDKIEDISKVDLAVDALTKLKEFSTSIPDLSSDQAVTSLNNFSNGIGGLADALIYFNDAITEDAAHGGVSKLNVDAIKDAASAGQAMSALANSLPERGGVLQYWIGEKDELAAFARQLPAFGTFMTQFSENVENLNVEVVQNAATAGSVMAELANKLPAHHGGLQWLMGEQETLSTFGENVQYFGVCIVEFANKVKDLDRGVVENAAACGTVMAELDSHLTGHGGVIQWFTGDNDLKTFGEKLPYLGVGLAGFAALIDGQSITVDGNTLTGYKVNADSVTVAGAALQVLAAVENGLPESPSFFSFFTGGGKDVDGFVSNLPKLGTGIAAFSKAIDDAGGINAANVEASGIAIGAVASISEIQNVGNIDSVVEYLPKIAENLKAYSDKLAEGKGFNATSVTQAVNAIHQLQGLEKSITVKDFSKSNTSFVALLSMASTFGQISNIDVDKIKAFGDAMKSLNDHGIADFFNSFGENADTYKQSALDMLNSFVLGVESSDNSFKTAFDKIADKGLETLRGRSAEFRALGADLSGEIIGGLTDSASNEDTGWNSEVTNMMSSAFGGNGSTDLMSKIMGGGSMEDLAGQFGNMLNGTGTGSLDFSGMDMSGLTDKFTGLFGGSIGDATSNIDPNQYLGKDSALNTNFESYLTGEDGKAAFGDLGGIISGDMFSSFSTDNTNFKMDTDTAMGNVASGLSTSADAKKDDIKKAGGVVSGYFLDGFVEGLDENIQKAKDGAMKIANATKVTMEFALEIHSPSKVAYRIGDYFGAGFVNALTDNVSKASSASSELANSATDGMQKALADSASLFDTSVDYQPTIRPVIDLSNVEKGALRLNTMLGSSNRSVRMSRELSYEMQSRAEIGPAKVAVDNSDLVNSIHALREDMGVMAERVTGMQIVLDTGTMVGEMASPIDKALGSRAIARKRG